MTCIETTKIDVEQLIKELNDFLLNNHIGRLQFLKWLFGNKANDNYSSVILILDFIFNKAVTIQWDIMTDHDKKRLLKIREFLNDPIQCKKFIYETQNSLKIDQNYEYEPLNKKFKPSNEPNHFKYQNECLQTSTEKQTLLRKYFRYNRYPSPGEIHYLANLLVLDIDQVKRWFDAYVLSRPLQTINPNQYKLLFERLMNHPDDSLINEVSRLINRPRAYVLQWLTHRRQFYREFFDYVSEYKRKQKELDEDNRDLVEEEITINDDDISVLEDCTVIDSSDYDDHSDGSTIYLD
jgi:hypothetical protein